MRTSRLLLLLITVLITVLALPLTFCVRTARAESEILVKYFDLTEGRVAFGYELDGHRNIYVLDFATLVAKPLFPKDGNNDSPRFSPDGSKILFSSDRSGDKEIFVADSDGGNVTRLTTSAGDDEDPDWSPDGKQIVFSSTRSGNGTDLYVMNADGSNVNALMKSSKQNTYPRWNPLGSSIIFMTNEYWPGNDLLLYDNNTKKITILTTGYISSLQPSWDRGGNQYAYVFGPVDDPDIWVQPLGNAKGNAVITRTGKDLYPEWMDNGKRLLFAGETEAGSNHYEIFLHELATKQTIQITETEGTIRGVSWSSTSPGKRKQKKDQPAAAPEVPQAAPATAPAPAPVPAPASSQAPAVPAAKK